MFVCWASLELVCILSKTPLEKIIILPFVSGCQLEIESDLGIWSCVHFSSQHWCPMWLGTVHVLRVLPRSLWVHLSVSPIVFRRPSFPSCLPSPIALTIFLFCFLSPKGRDLIETSYLRMSVSVSLSLTCRNLNFKVMVLRVGVPWKVILSDVKCNAQLIFFIKLKKFPSNSRILRLFLIISKHWIWSYSASEFAGVHMILVWWPHWLLSFEPALYIWMF